MLQVNIPIDQNNSVIDTCLWSLLPRAENLYVVAGPVPRPDEVDGDEPRAAAVVAGVHEVRGKDHQQGVDQLGQGVDHLW